MKIHPTAHRVLVELIYVDEEEKSSGGIIVTTSKFHEARKRAMQEAFVVEIGPTAFRAFDDGVPWCKVGDRVMIAKYSGEDRADEDTGTVLRVINDEDIFAVLEE
jgi:co-chaperonin GroES (HSP10)